MKEDLPLILASNRDEFYNRGGEKPALREEGGYSYLAPRDPQAGGTWLGINEAGLVVALTNQPDPEEDSSAPSRGKLVNGLLEKAENVSAAKQWLGGKKLQTFNPFSIVVVGSKGLYYYRLNKNDEIRKKNEEKCCFFLSNQTSIEIFPPSARDRFPWGGHGTETSVERLRGRLQNFCRQHHGFKDHENLCRHGEESGTVSSSIILLDLKDNKLHYDYAPGPPCKKRYIPVEVSTDFNRKVIQNW